MGKYHNPKLFRNFAKTKKINKNSVNSVEHLLRSKTTSSKNKYNLCAFREK